MIVITETIDGFDNYLSKRQLTFDAVIIGGAALNLLGVVSRLTRDCEVLDPNITQEVLLASEEYATDLILKNPKSLIQKNWLNNEPADLKNNLPKGWGSRLQSVYRGKAIRFQSLGYLDLLKTKLYA
ncbi:MAG: hypothetical protein H7328_00160 [Bdellovibrio sp.]|nr:hypothetical protein [Bdellovibrio sp.]